MSAKNHQNWSIQFWAIPFQSWCIFLRHSVVCGVYTRSVGSGWSIVAGYVYVVLVLTVVLSPVAVWTLIKMCLTSSTAYVVEPDRSCTGLVNVRQHVTHVSARTAVPYTVNRYRYTAARITSYRLSEKRKFQRSDVCSRQTDEVWEDHSMHQLHTHFLKFSS